MSFELGATTAAGLKQAGQASAGLNVLVQEAYQTALTGKTTKESGTVAYKEAFAALLTLIFESARHDAHLTDLQTVLEDATWPADAINQFATLFQQHKETLRQGSASASTSVPSLTTLSATASPSIVDVHWRVDDYLRSDALDQVRVPTYLLELTTTNPGATQTSTSSTGPATTKVPFSCNFQQLQDLLAKLKDAQKQIQQRVE